MTIPTDGLLKITFLMFRTLLTKGSRRRRLMHNHQHVLRERLLRFYRIRRAHSKLAQERMLYLKMLNSWVQANSSRKRKHLRPTNWFEKTVMETFSNTQWLKYFRMRKETFLYLVDKMKTHLVEDDTLPVDKQVAIVVLFFASGKSQNSIAYQFEIELDKVVDVVNNVTSVIVKVLLPQYIIPPKTQVLKEYLNDFETKWGFPQCAGVLGSIHIPVSSSELPENAADYINSDGSHSMFLQAVVDPSYKFWDINVGWPGSVSESRVLTSSALWVKGQEGMLFPDWTKFMGVADVPIFILAGSSYPLAEWVMKPFQYTKPEQPDEQKFNEKFAFAYNTCEIAFKRLKARWNCLVKENLCSIDIFPQVAAACCTLHNICEIHKDPILDEWIVKAENGFKQPLPSSCNSVIGPQAEYIREAVKDYFLISD